MLWSNILKIIYRAINFIHRYFNIAKIIRWKFDRHRQKIYIYILNKEHIGIILLETRIPIVFSIYNLSEMIINKISIELSRSRYKDWQDIINRYLCKVPDNQLVWLESKTLVDSNMWISVLNLNIPRYNLISFFSKSLITCYIFVFLLLLLSM